MTNKTQPRDWNKAIDAIIKAMEHRYVSEFRSVAFPILQEFDAQNQANLSDNDVCGVDMGDKSSELENAQLSYQRAMADLDMLIEQIAKHETCSLPWYSTVVYMRKNYPKQWEKYMARETAPTEAPKENFSGCTVSNTTSGIKFTSQPPTFTFEEPLELVIGELYEFNTNVIEFLGINNHRKDQYCNTFIDVESGNTLHLTKDEVKRHPPAPKQHEVDFSISVLSDGSLRFRDKPRSDIDTQSALAVLHFKRSFLEGEGL